MSERFGFSVAKAAQTLTAYLKRDGPLWVSSQLTVDPSILKKELQNALMAVQWAHISGNYKTLALPYRLFKDISTVRGAGTLYIHTAKGNGVFVEGSIERGHLITCYAGTHYTLQQLFIKQGALSDPTDWVQGNAYILKIDKDFMIDGSPHGQSKDNFLRYAKEAAAMGVQVDSSWLEDGKAVSMVNHLGLGPFVNHPPHRTRANAAFLPIEIYREEIHEELLKYLPVVESEPKTWYARVLESRKLKSFRGHLSRTAMEMPTTEDRVPEESRMRRQNSVDMQASGHDNHGTSMSVEKSSPRSVEVQVARPRRVVVMVATRDICDEEIFINYGRDPVTLGYVEPIEEKIKFDHWF